MQFYDSLAQLNEAYVQRVCENYQAWAPDLRMRHVRGNSDLAVEHFARLARFLNDRGWYVQTTNPRGDSAYGWCLHSTKEIYVGRSWKNQMLFNLIHEGTHALELERHGMFVLRLRGLFAAEVVAESTAYVVANYCGLGGNTLLRASHYLSAWAVSERVDASAGPLDFEPEITELATTILEGLGY